MDNSLKALVEWFQVKSQDRKLIPDIFACLERERAGATLKLNQLERTGSLDEIRYQRGLKDGVTKIFDVLERSRLSESKNPLATGLMRRILNYGETNA